MSEKTEEPTSKRLEQSRERGEVALSRDAVTAAALLGAVMGAGLTASRVRSSFGELLGRSLTALERHDVPSPTAALAEALTVTLRASAPVLGGAVTLAALCAALQTRFLVAPVAALPKLERLDPFGALAKFTRVRTWIEPAVQLGKGGLLAGAGLSLVWTRASAVGLHNRGAAALAVVMADALGAVAWRMVALAIVCGVLDGLYRQIQHRRDLRMSHEEVKREHKESEGDGQLKAARERLHHELLQEATLAAVQRASFVVTNPTHYAVALRYEHEETDAPEVLAKGSGELARKIIAEAHRAGIPVLRDAPLARSLHQLEIGEQIPEGLYEAVAAIVNHLAGGHDPDGYPGDGGG